MLCLLLACGGPESGGVPAGSIPAGAPLGIDGAARLGLGVVDGDTLQEFDRVRTPFLLPDDRLVVPWRAPA